MAHAAMTTGPFDSEVGGRAAAPTIIELSWFVLSWTIGAARRLPAGNIGLAAISRIT